MAQRQGTEESRPRGARGANGSKRLQDARRDKGSKRLQDARRDKGSKARDKGSKASAPPSANRMSATPLRGSFPLKTTAGGACARGAATGHAGGCRGGPRTQLAAGIRFLSGGGVGILSRYLRHRVLLEDLLHHGLVKRQHLRPSRCNRQVHQTEPKPRFPPSPPQQPPARQGQHAAGRVRTKWLPSAPAS